MKAAFTFLLLLLASSRFLAAEEAAPGKVIDLASRRELFVDDYLLDQLGGAEFRMHRPEPREVVLTCDAPWEGNTSAYYTLFQDGDKYRMYYRGAHFEEATKKPAHPEFACYAESADGLHWEKPKLGLVEFNGSKENNILWAGPGTHNFTPFKDGNPRCPPEARYKALASGAKGLLPFQSADGIHWSLMQETPVITAGAFDSQNLAFWDGVRGEYRAYWRYFTAKPEGHRAIRTATSKDFLHWENQADLQYGATPSEHLYTNAIAPYFRAPHLLLGFPTRFQPKHQQVEPVLMTSRDGVHFQRWTEPLIPITAPQDRDGNRSNYMTSGLLQRPGNAKELSVYATEAYYTGPGSRVRRFTFRTDGFVSLYAGETPANIVTKPFQFAGKTLTLNYAALEGGKIRIELQDATGKAISGYGLADCQPLQRDAIDATVTWAKGSDLSALAGQPIRLRIELRKADLYALQFAP